jgi:hypothetical protein
MLPTLRRHELSSRQRIVAISVVGVVMGSLFVATYSLALAEPVPHRIEVALIGDPAASPRTIAAVEKVADGKLVFERYGSVAGALNALNHQDVYAALDLASSRPIMYVAGAAGVSVARVLERVGVVDPSMRVIDTPPRSSP